MIHIITNKTSTVFSINGIHHQRNFVVVLSGERINIINSYDTKLVILSDVYTNIEVNGVVHATPQETANALTPVLFTKNIVVSGGASVSTSNTLNFFNSTDGVIHQGITGNLVIDPTGQVVGGEVLIDWTGDSNPDITGVSSSLIKILSDDISEQGNYTIGIRWTGQKYLVAIKANNPYVGSGGGGNVANAPTNLTLTEGTTSTVANAPTGLSLTEGTY